MPKAVLITGAAKRVGRVIALHLAGAGYDIAAHYHTSETEAKSLAREVEALGRKAVLLKADLADAGALPGLVQQALAALPHCHALVNNASVFERKPFLEADEDSFDSNIALNLKAPVFLTQAFAKAAPRPAAVVNLLDSKITHDHHAYFFYLLAKKALADFTRMAAAELGPEVRVNAVCPGVVMPSSDGALDEAYSRKEAQAAVLKRNAEPWEVAEAVHYLLENPALTGQFVFVDGGASLR